MTSSRSLPVFCTLIAALAFTTHAHAQRSAADIESARQAYNQGITLRDAGDIRGALEKFRAAHALGNTPITGLELCKSYASLRMPVEAREVCLSVARIPPLAGETSRSGEARREAAQVAEDVRPKIATIKLRLTGVPPGREAVVQVDGFPIPAAALGEPRAINPGPHQITAHVGRGGDTRATFDVKEGEVRDLELPVQPPPPDEPAAPPAGQPAQPGPKEEKKNSLQIIGLGIGAAGVGLGAIAGVVAMSAKSDLDERCVNNICGKDDFGKLDSAKTWGTVSTVSFVIGGVGLAVALVATLTAPKSTAQTTTPAPKTASAPPIVTPTLGLGGVGIHGAF